MTELMEHDAMVCRACGNEERASEGYPCDDCGTFVCQICSMRGVTRCEACAARRASSADGGGNSGPSNSGPDKGQPDGSPGPGGAAQSGPPSA